MKNWKNWAAIAAPPICGFILVLVLMRLLFPWGTPIRVGADNDWACVDKSRKTAKISTKAQVSTLGTIS